MMTKLDPITERSVMKYTAFHTLMIDFLKCILKNLTFFKENIFLFKFFRFNWGCVVSDMLKSVMLIMLCLIFNLVDDQRNF